MAKLIKPFENKQYRYKTSDEYGEFSYFWSFCSYMKDEKFVKLIFMVEQEGYTDDSIANFKSYLDYPELASVVEKIVRKYDGNILIDMPAAFGFTFVKKQDMFDFIKSISEIMYKNGIFPYDGIDRVSAFPSYEYATDMFTYLFNEDCSLPEIEEHIGKCAGMTGLYGEVSGLMELPVVSDIKFNPNETTETPLFGPATEEFMAKCSEKLGANAMHGLQELNKKNTVNVTTEVSKDYNSFSEMWL